MREDEIKVEHDTVEDTRTETHWLRKTGGADLLRQKLIFKQFAWGEGLIEQRLGPTPVRTSGNQAHERRAGPRRVGTWQQRAAPGGTTAYLGVIALFKRLQQTFRVRYMGARGMPSVLLAEDNENDILMFRRAARRANFTQPLNVVSNGEEAIAYLKGEGKFDDREEFPLPGLVLLDLKMPRMNGFDVLQWVREQPQFASMQVVVLTSSDEIRDINRAYQLGANSFLVKPLSFDEFVGMLEALRSYCQRVWQTLGRLKAAEAAPVPAI